MSTSAEVVAAVRELSGPGVKQVEIASKAGCSKSQVSLATTLLTRAPDLAEAVSAGRLGLSRASAMARQRQRPAPPHRLPDDAEWLPPVFLTVTEAAAKLSRHRSAVLRWGDEVNCPGCVVNGVVQICGSYSGGRREDRVQVVRLTAGTPTSAANYSGIGPMLAIGFFDSEDDCN
jgi:hypothetical protein